ncbi:MAG: glycosyltransferase, partial [Lachnospiraceae bacterium]|nr:glycosyltransferase [Lachnospiraceae bacterium]
MGTLYIVVPCYNEEEALEESAKSLMKKLEELKEKSLVSEKSRIVFVDDGSKDQTWSLIEKLYQKHESIIGLRFAHNRGHQNAILAGMMYAKDFCEFCITIDADLQQDINAMELFIEEYYAGNEIVYGVRNSR